MGRVVSAEDRGDWPVVHYSYASGQSTCGLELRADLGRPLGEADRVIIDEVMTDLQPQAPRPVDAPAPREHRVERALAR